VGVFNRVHPDQLIDNVDSGSFSNAFVDATAPCARPRFSLGLQPKSAEVARRSCVDRCALVRSRSSAAHNDTHRYAEAWPISIHTEEHNQFKINNPVPPAGLAPGWSPALTVITVGRHQVARVSRRVSAKGGAGKDEPADATGYPLQPSPFCKGTTTVVLSACCKEGSIVVSCGTSRCSPSAGQRVSPGTVGRFPSSRREFDSRNPLHYKGTVQSHFVP
jgi:hypothetical protein